MKVREPYIDSAGDPDVAVLVVSSAIPCEVLALESGEVGLLESLMVTLQGSHHARPWLSQRQNPLPRALWLLVSLNSSIQNVDLQHPGIQRWITVAGGV